MANLRGGSYEKQINNACHRMERLGESKQFDNDKNAHSAKVLDDRRAMLNDFANYATDTLNSSEKLNTLMTNENINNFLRDRLADVQSNTAETYARGFSAMTDSLQSNNITINLDKEIINSVVSDAKINDTSSIEINRSINNLDSLYKDLGTKHEMSRVLAEVQATLGLRVSEAMELVKNVNDYVIKDINEVAGLNGKGGKEYIIKDIPASLVNKIENIEKQISQSTYQKDLAALGEKSHNLRITYSKNEYEKNISEGMSHKSSLAAVSNELNHNREDITVYYLNRA